jgi:hypothetical protein|mmetsp:Transcript_15933/g.2640  ORF Transcript_15933/g.2640 Transcript_15933/m.2640 type:complete len:99 (+) Transcript_15933:134-430(+)
MPTTFRERSRLYLPPEGMKYPRECAKFVSRYMDCRSDNGERGLTNPVPACDSRKAEIFEQCPHWVLENMKLKKKVFKRYEEIDNETYRRAMEISDYNR